MELRKLIKHVSLLAKIAIFAGVSITANSISIAARVSDEDKCQVFSFLSEANETPHFQADGDMCRVDGFESDTPSCPLLMEGRWLCR